MLKTTYRGNINLYSATPPERAVSPSDKKVFKGFPVGSNPHDLYVLPQDMMNPIVHLVKEEIHLGLGDAVG